MHGIIFSELKKFVESKHGAAAWSAILAEAGLGKKSYMIVSVYPDEEASAILAAAAKQTRTPVDRLMEGFGEFVVPSLLAMYGSLLNPEWKTIGMLLNTEETIHRVVRMKNPGAEPPKLVFEQVGPKELKFHYNSPRRMAGVAKGMIKGVAKFFHETVMIQETKKADGSSEMKIIVS